MMTTLKKKINEQEDIDYESDDPSDITKYIVLFIYISDVSVEDGDGRCHGFATKGIHWKFLSVLLDLVFFLFFFGFVINEWNFEHDKYNNRIWVPLLSFLSSEYKFGNDLEIHLMHYLQQKQTVTLHCDCRWKRQTCSRRNAPWTVLPWQDGTISIRRSGALS